MEASESLQEAWGRLESLPCGAVRLRWPSTVRVAAKRVVLWWGAHARHVMRIASVVGGTLVFLALTHFLLSLLSPPSGL
jgi:hypothetical protein